MGKKERIIVFAVGLVLLIIFTFTDLQISTVLYTKNIFGRIFEITGEIPFIFLSLFGSALLLRMRSKTNRVLNIAAAAIALLFLLLFAFMGGFMTWNYLNKNVGQTLPVFVPVLIGLVLLVLALLLARCVPEKYAHRAVTYAVTAIVYFIAVIVIMNLLKSCMGRMRMREMTDPLTQFTRWYVVNDRGGFNDIYASFPSGHSMNSAAVILVTLLPSFVPALAGKRKLLHILAYVWIILVGSSRIVMGAHFASDVTVGILLSLLLFEIIQTIVGKVRKNDLTKALDVY